MSMRAAPAVEPSALTELRKARSQVIQVSTPTRVAEALREQISGGHFPPGSRLGEEVIADALGVSRNTVREAFVELAGDRLVVRRPNRGVFVATLTAADVVDIFAARRTIEVGAVRAGGSRVIVANARLVLAEAIAARDAGDDPTLARADRHFHRALVALANSSRLNRLIRQMVAEIRWVLNAAGAGSGLFSSYVDDNERVCRLLESGKNAAAARAVHDTLIRTEQDVLRAIRRDGS